MSEKNFSEFAQKLNLVFKDESLLRLAFTHRSYLNEHREEAHRGHNERLEFLGDAVLELTSTRFLYDRFPTHQEGDLTAYRAALVNANTLSEVAARIGMNDYLLLSKGEAKDLGRARQILLANAFEALIGAVYLDQGYDGAEHFLSRYLFPKIDEIVKKRLWQDAKSAFQEKAQEHEGETPTYAVLREEGPDHDKQFVMGVYVRNVLVAEGEGRSKQEAEQEAARAGLERKGW
ncbi:MAG: ribonuclease III [Patescibacteria group bacterium]|nr:ribonuclease III [Patescibacteria group bacterium]